MRGGRVQVRAWVKSYDAGLGKELEGEDGAALTLQLWARRLAARNALLRRRAARKAFLADLAADAVVLADYMRFVSRTGAGNVCVGGGGCVTYLSCLFFQMLLPIAS